MKIGKGKTMDYFKDVPDIDGGGDRVHEAKDFSKLDTGASKKANKIALKIFGLQGMKQVKKDDPDGEFYAAVARMIDKEL